MTKTLTNLSSLIDTAVIYSNDGTVSVTTSNGTALVSGNQSDALTTQVNSSTGMQDVFAQGTDITSSIAGGQLQGLISSRDDSIPCGAIFPRQSGCRHYLGREHATNCRLRPDCLARCS